MRLEARLMEAAARIGLLIESGMLSKLSHSEDRPVVIVGAGLAGLACAQRLQAAGVALLLLDAADAVGGRVRTDNVEGFLLDRGFQVLLPAYPAAAQVLDYRGLALRPFYPGALIQLDKRRYRFADPWRKPLASVKALAAPVAGLSDVLRIARLRSVALRGGYADGRQETTLAYLQRLGFSQRVIDRFFRPFFGGVFLERELQTPAAFFRFLFAMFAQGPATLPAQGMQTIPQQIADALPAGSVRLNTPVAAVQSERVRLASGEEVACAAVVVAADADAAGRLLPDVPTVAWHGTTTVYFAAQRSPLSEGILLLNGMGCGLVNHVCVPSDVAERYAPPGASLVSVSILGEPPLDDAALAAQVTEELRGWLGAQTADWSLLRVYRVRHALPALSGSAPVAAPRQDGVILCGDYLESASINGAFVSGRRAAEALLAAARA